MSKTYFGRCAAVGIAGLTAMSSIAFVASAATQASLVYELKYNGIEKAIMKTSVAYATDSTQYCQRGTSGVALDDGFNVAFTNLKALTADYQAANIGTNNSIYYTAATSTAVWDDADFSGTNISKGMSATGWKYMAPKANDPTTPVEIKAEEVYAKRDAAAADNIIAFKTESERTAAQNAIITTAKNAYTAVANPAATQFRNDINAAAANAKKRLENTKNNTIDTAKTAYEGSAKDAAATADYNKAVNTATNLYNASVNAITTSANKIISEFTQTFNANNFNFDFAFESNNAPIVYSSTVGGLSVVDDAKYKSFGATDVTLADSRYWNGSTLRNDEKSYVFKGEIQPKGVFDGTKAFVFIGNTLNWVNFEVIDNGSTTGGNTNSNGNTTNNNTKKDDTTTTVTTWYPDSAAYRAASEVSYLGKNGSWYTSSSAASVYGNGYTGTSKNSNFSDVNKNANGKAIYFNSTTGTYSTSSSTYSYVVKEATTTTTDTNNDPYYSYFFNNGNKNNTTTSVPAGSPAISGASKYAGWTNISAYITNRAKSGATYTINMNDGTVVPATVLAAAKAKNVTLVFANDNGSKVTVKPGKVSTTSDLNVAVTYNVKDVKSSLVKKAKKVNKGTVSTAQVRIGTDGSIGGTETVTVKFSTKRAGCTVKAYRLTESGSLKKEASGTVASTGRANLNLTKGGSYLLVVIDD